MNTAVLTETRIRDVEVTDEAITAHLVDGRVIRRGCMVPSPDEGASLWGSPSFRNHIVCDDELPPTDRPWDTYMMGVAPAPTLTDQTVYALVAKELAADTDAAHAAI